MKQYEEVVALLERLIMIGMTNRDMGSIAKEPVWIVCEECLFVTDKPIYFEDERLCPRCWGLGTKEEHQLLVKQAKLEAEIAEIQQYRGYIKEKQREQQTDPQTAEVAYSLTNVEERARAHPQTFEIPLEIDRRTLKPGDWAKLIFNDAERMWVMVDKQYENGGYRGLLRSDPLCVSNLRRGDVVMFQPHHVAGIIPATKKKQP